MSEQQPEDLSSAAGTRQTKVIAAIDLASVLSAVTIEFAAVTDGQVFSVPVKYGDFLSLADVHRRTRNLNDCARSRRYCALGGGSQANEIDFVAQEIWIRDCGSRRMSQWMLFREPTCI